MREVAMTLPSNSWKALISTPKIIAISCSDAIMVKMAEKPQTNGEESS